MEWWYSKAAPIEPQNSTPHDREAVRVGRLSSVILFIMFCFGISLLPNAIFSANHFYLPIVLIAMSITFATLLLNRKGKAIAAGIIMVCMLELAFLMVTLTSPGGLSIRNLSTFDLITLTELVAVSLLPPKSVLPVTIYNVIFTWAVITFFPKSADFPILNTPTYYGILIRPITLQIIVAIITYLWVQGATRAIARAEMVAALERGMAEKDRIIADQKQQLDQGIQQILQTHIQVANGNFNARAPLAQENVLWQVAYNLNNLLARLQRSAQSEQELQQTKMQAAHMLEAVHSARMKRHPIRVSKGGTCLDQLAQELSDNYIGQ